MKSSIQLNLPEETATQLEQLMVESAKKAFDQAATQEALPMWLKLSEAREYANVSNGTLQGFINEGLKVSIINGVKRISKKSIDEFFEKHTY
ncbi:helix-turn-helix domain-containing protein [Loigolactobacillus backii]|uniref:helix-turn-helix domain-containing protein n=1 Tax=Loigolactobacillus backii TaxID=375175 RepID=UPI000C1C89E1|nr:helix-turn-helix domain-containing protein [Loigolactobacillus backii]MDA5388579.1 helix-turn-helix domain-containing protein [Loigolactobacillus backii]MDA5391033.1 helix-turn-helix domain-containing protein [Loigolactobacillus backii]PIO83802.1 hypothetical protein BSQ39_09595 [Loigolactobacillus backii]